MLIEEEILSPIKTLENEIRLFIYDFAQLSGCPEAFTPIFNLLSNMIPIQYVLKEFFATNDKVLAGELKLRSCNYFGLVVQEFRKLEKFVENTGSVDRTKDVWYSLYKANVAIYKSTGASHFFVKEFKPYMEC